MTALRCVFRQAGQGTQDQFPGSDGLLGALRFSSGGTSGQPDFCAPRCAAALPMPPLGPAGAIDPVDELWITEGSATRGNAGAVRYSHDGNILFGIIELAEDQFRAPVEDAPGGEATPLRRASESAYEAIFRATASLGFPFILRFWNYIADINGESHGMERYRQFNLGRQDGFRRSGYATEGASVPAASAVGFPEGPLTVCFLATRHARPEPIENPRQVSAYRYPAEYGPRSPTFSRASVVRIGGGDVLFISGTASIVGHRTLHAGDVAAQTRETVANLAAVVEQANIAAPAAGFALSDLYCKVYVRHERDVSAIRTELERCPGISPHMLQHMQFLRADICRQDLLVEIEATSQHLAESYRPPAA